MVQSTNENCLIPIQAFQAQNYVHFIQNSEVEQTTSDFHLKSQFPLAPLKFANLNYDSIWINLQHNLIEACKTFHHHCCCTIEIQVCYRKCDVKLFGL